MSDCQLTHRLHVQAYLGIIVQIRVDSVEAVLDLLLGLDDGFLLLRQAC